MRWLRKKRADVIRRWKANEIGMAQAANELCALGVPPLQAWHILMET